MYENKSVNNIGAYWYYLRYIKLQLPKNKNKIVSAQRNVYIEHPCFNNFLKLQNDLQAISVVTPKIKILMFFTCGVKKKKESHLKH